MSIIVSVKVRDGIILGADSTTQIYLKDQQGRVGVAKTYSNARKLFQIGDLKIGVMTYGAGNIGNRSAQGWLRDFSERVKCLPKEEKTSVQKVTVQLLDFLGTEYNTVFKDVPENEKPLIGIFVGGYSKDNAFPEEWEFQLPRKPKVKQVRPQETFGASWRGISLPFSRLHMGFDPRMKDRLKQLGVSEDIIAKALDGWQSSVAYDAMPVQDAINFAYYILRTTVSFNTFELGPPACGGPLDIAVILPDTGFNWVTERQLSIHEYQE